MQLAANVLVAASAVLLMALGFSLIFSVTRFFHFAHGAVYAAAPYLAFALTARLGCPFALAVPLAVVFAAVLGCVIDITIYRPLRRRRSPALVLLLASLGTYIVLQNLISMVFGDDTKQLRSGAVREGMSILGARVTWVQVTTVCASLALLIAVTMVLRRTRLGQAMRAVASDPELANVCGLDSNHVILWTFAIGSALAGVAGVLVALDVDMTPTMGMHALMLAVVAVIVGGVGRTVGLAAAALLLAAAQQAGVWWLGSQWQDVTAFVILLAFLLVRPQGMLGRKTRKASV